MRIAPHRALVALSMLGGFAMACSAGKIDTSTLLSNTNDGGGAGGGDDSGFQLDGGGGNQDGFSVDGSGGGGNPVGDACAGTKVKAQLTPLDLMIMQDQSGSMSDTVASGGTKWQAVTGAIGDFVSQPGLDGISVGIQYFPLPASGGGSCTVTSCTTDADCGGSACGPCIVGMCLGAAGGSSDSCTVADYATPEVEIAALPGVASAIKASLAKHGPTNSTPTSAALQGAADHAKAWATAHPGHKVAVVMATDGLPTECDTTSADIVKIASDAYGGTPSISTYTIGVFAPADGSSGSTLLNQISAAGGSSKAFTIDTSTGNVAQAFLDALNTVRGTQLGCEYQIPSGSQNDYGAVNVVFTPATGSAQYFPYVGSAGACGAAGGWYYDVDPKVSTPTKIELCPATCNNVKGQQNASIDIEIGCKTVIQ